MLRAVAAVWAAGALVGVTAEPAPAPHVAQLQVNPDQMRPGDTVSVFGPRGYGRTNPVQIRLDSETGPVLGSFQPDQQRFAQWGPGTVTIPADTPPGRHMLVATQELPDADSGIRGIPARAVIEVLGPGGLPARGAPLAAPTEARTTGVEVREGDGVPVGPVVLVGLGVAGIAMLAAGAASLLAGRRAPGAEAHRAPVERGGPGSSWPGWPSLAWPAPPGDRPAARPRRPASPSRSRPPARTSSPPAPTPTPTCSSTPTTR